MAGPGSTHYGWWRDIPNSQLEVVVAGTSEVTISNTIFAPTTSDGLALGSSSLMWGDLFLASGGVINFNNGDVTITHSANTLAFAGGSYTFSGAVTPATNDGSALGTTALMWSDLFLASGGVVNFNNGDVTLTHSTNLLTLAGGDLVVANGNGVIIGNGSQITIDTEVAELQVLGSTVVDSLFVIGRFSADAGDGELRFFKTRSTDMSQQTFTSVNDNDRLGRLQWYVDDGADHDTAVARFGLEVDDASPAAGDIGVAFYWFQMPGGAGAIAETWRMTASGQFVSGGLGPNPANVTADGSILAEGGIAFTDVANAWIDDATHGTGTTTHYIGNEAITTSSDVRVKTDVVDWKGNALDLLRQAHLVEYTYNLPGGGDQDSGYGPNARGRYVGMLAQETIEWAPWVINAGAGKDCPRCVAGQPCDDHSFWHVEYQHLVPVVVKGIQELEAEVEGLKAEVAALKGA
jgi:hypothetical protein